MTRKDIVRNTIGLLIIVGIVFWVRSGLPPSERSVVRRFERHRQSLEKMLAMLAVDPNIASVGTYGMSEGHGCGQPEEIGFSRQRCLEYRALLKYTRSYRR